jgi:hypothetical protein
VVLAKLQVLIPTEALRQGVPRAFGQDAIDFRSLELEPSAGPGPSWHPSAQRSDQLADPWAPVPFPFQVRPDEPHTARDVESDAPRGNHTVVFGIHRRHAADREAIPPMDVRHGERSGHDAGERGHVRHLLDRAVLDGLRHEVLRGEHDARNPHPEDRTDGDAPLELPDALGL